MANAHSTMTRAFRRPSGRTARFPAALRRIPVQNVCGRQYEDYLALADFARKEVRINTPVGLVERYQRFTYDRRIRSHRAAALQRRPHGEITLLEALRDQAEQAVEGRVTPEEVLIAWKPLLQNLRRAQHASIHH